ncbi:uncharacterized protein LOC129247228 [Anastrepha obliqua]|uniref:uncharacterized protein LOC129247228 n=1 Tax=Anastrepha obliqua TaxID=95512 RepID=UPI00240A8352|nr:uncharacterized protein LOC129247228 [Anastrepha obliqua]
MDKEAKTTLSEALSLLVSWKLPHLCNKFEEHEVCTESFRYLTDEDICALIPKIGPRAIFRSRLLSWRQQQEFKKQDPIVLLSSGHVDTTTVAIKDEFQETSPEAAQTDIHFEIAAREQELFEDSDSKTVSVMSEKKCDESVTEGASPTKKQLDVQSVLNNCYEGINALEYYRENGGLDMHLRKKVVKIVVGAALDKRMDMSVNDFHSMNQQLLRLFPNESDDTFYMPRVGNTRARGMLYNKYVNLSRRLRRDGLLEYKRHWSNKRR